MLSTHVQILRIIFQTSSENMANVIDENTRNEALLEVANLLEMARSVPNIVDPVQRANTLSTVIAMFEGMAIDEGGADGVWNRQETDAVLEQLRGTEPNNEEESIRGLVEFLTGILE